MRLTRRDVSVIRDLALSHVMSRDQIIAAGYFGSVTRVNTRLRELVGASLVRRLGTPFFGQGLYVAGRIAPEIVGEHISKLIESRLGSPRFIRHALSVTNVRLALMAKSSGQWRFEQQLWRKLEQNANHEVRPDGLYLGGHPIFIEVDMGHVAPQKFRVKLLAYRALAQSGRCNELYGFPQFKVLVMTTGPLRARHLRQLLPPNPGFEYLVQTFEEVGALPIPTWS